MYVKLTIAERLKDLRVEKRLTLEQLAEQTGLSKSALGSYEADDYKDISPFAVTTLAKFYGVSTDYLLGLTEQKNHPNTALHELHLSDSAVDLLKSGRLNARLLSELLCHPEFPRLMTDVEVCVDRIADMHIRDMNLLLEQSRQKVQSKYHPDENDLALRTLELAQISEDIFYKDVLHRDLDAIVRGIREAHEKDSTTADRQTDAEALLTDMGPILEEALRYEGTADRKRAFLVCRILDIDYDRLPEEDRGTLARVLKKSPKLISVISQRGKAPAHGKKRKR